MSESECFPGFVYKPPTEEEIEPKKSTLGVKFSNDLFLSEAWLVKMNIEYEPEDIEQTPLGPCARIKRDKALDELTEQAQDMNLYDSKE